MISRFASLDVRYRDRLAEILARTDVFSSAEVALALELFDETYATRSSAAEQAAVVREPTSHGPPAYEFLGAFDDDGQLVAYACYGATPSTDGTFDLYWIAVDDAVRGRGVGRQLLGEVESQLQTRGARLVVAETSSRSDYEPTRRFYDRRAYREVARVASFYAPGDDRLIYAKRLTSEKSSDQRPIPGDRSTRHE